MLSQSQIWQIYMAGLFGCALVFGCHGPLTKPMVDRLDDETQSKVDEVWEAMFTPVDGLDSTFLLDLILSAQLHQMGVDHLRMVSEKYVGDGLVVMEVRFDRENPEFDEFSLSYIDSQGNETRRERFSRLDVEERVQFLSLPVVEEEMPADTDEARAQRLAERRARAEELDAFLGPIVGEDAADGEGQEP